VSQQINLLAPAKARLALPIALGVTAMLAVAVVLVVRSSHSELSHVREQADASRQQVAELKAAFEKAQQRQSIAASGAKLEDEVAVMRSRAAAAADLLGQVDSGSLGQRGGYSPVFQALASTADDSVWITGVAARGARNVSITGVALTNEAALQYSRRVADALRTQGVTFRSLELKPVNSPTGATAPAVGFKLS
jgi:hypothetical protein